MASDAPEPFVISHRKVIDVIKQATVKSLEQTNKQLYEALEGVMQLIADGKLIRCTSDDANPDWAMRQLPFVLALSAAETALAKAREDGSVIQKPANVS